MAYQLVHVQPLDEGEASQLWLANTSPDDAVVAVRKAVPQGWEAKLVEAGISEKLTSHVDLAPGAVCEFDDVSDEMRRS